MFYQCAAASGLIYIAGASVTVEKVLLRVLQLERPVHRGVGHGLAHRNQFETSSGNKKNHWKFGATSFCQLDVSSNCHLADLFRRTKVEIIYCS